MNTASIDLTAITATEDLAWVASIRMRAGTAVVQWEEAIGTSQAEGETVSMNLNLDLPDPFAADVGSSPVATNVRLRGYEQDGTVRQQVSLPLVYLTASQDGRNLYTQREAKMLTVKTTPAIVEVPFERAANEIDRVDALPPKVSSFDADAEESVPRPASTEGVQQ